MEKINFKKSIIVNIDEFNPLTNSQVKKLKKNYRVLASNSVLKNTMSKSSEKKSST
jgi:hypothetical protein